MSFKKSNLKEISIPSSVKEIGENAFSDCFFLQKVTISEESDLHSIGANAFLYTSIESFFIPSKVSFIGAASLSTRWQKLKSVKISPLNNNFSIFNDSFLLAKSDLHTTNFDILLAYIHNDSNNDVMIIPSFIRRICAFSFCYSKHVKYLIFENDSIIESLDDHAFSHLFIDKIRIRR